MDSNPVIEEYIICDSSDESDSGSPKPSTSESENDQFQDQSKLQVGILSEAFVILRSTSEACKRDNIPTTCALLIGELKLTQKYELYQGKMFGFTEGAGKSNITEPTKLASKAVIFMVISLVENWKIPVGLFFVHDPDLKYFADIIEEILDELNNVGVDIVSVTMNCLSMHFGFALANELGADIDVTRDSRTFRTYFQHPSKKHAAELAAVYVLYDLDTILPQMKSYWARNGVILEKDNPITFSFCEKVKKFEKKSDSSNVVTDYKWMILKKKLLYDTNILGRPYADALAYLKDLGYSEFQGTEATIQFIRALYFITLLLEVNGQEGQIWLNMSQANEDQWKPDVFRTITYFKNIRSSNKTIPEHLSFVKRCTVGIIVYFMSLYGMYKASIDPKLKSVSYKYRLPSILPSRFGLKHISMGIFEKLKRGSEPSALDVFKKIKKAAESLLPIDVEKV